MKSSSLGIFSERRSRRIFGAVESATSRSCVSAFAYPGLSALGRLFLVCCGALALFGTAEKAAAHDFAASTHLLDVRQGSTRSDVVKTVSRGSYELADGTPVDFSDWYSSVWIDLEVDFLTELSSELGLIWGISTGERGEKYRISPGLKIGFVYSLAPTPNSTLSLNASTRLGSSLREKHCMADYGEIGGIQPVNCRLAASALEPAETLKHDLRLNGFGDTTIAMTYELRF